jgi:hypothetical protein
MNGVTFLTGNIKEAQDNEGSQSEDSSEDEFNDEDDYDDDKMIDYFQLDEGNLDGDDTAESEHENDDDDMRDYYLPEKDGIFERDDFDHFVTSNFDPDVTQIEDDDNDIPLGDVEENIIPTTDAGEVHYDVDDDMELKGVLGDITINGHTILNQCGSLLTRKTHELKGSSKQKFFLQKICSTSIGNSLPLLYPEGLLLPSIYYSSAGDNLSILGAIPFSLMSAGTYRFGFEEIPKQIRSNMTTPHTSTSSNRRYISLCYDIAVNLSANREDTRCILNHGLTVAQDKVGGLGIRGKDDSTLLDEVDSKAMVRNLCSSQVHHKMDVFLTFTCNMKKHFGTKVVKKWLDEKSWKECINDYDELDPNEKKEMDESITQASSILLVRIWQEVCELFLSYLRKSSNSPYKNVRSMFARFEYQKCKLYQFNLLQLTKFILMFCDETYSERKLIPYTFTFRSKLERIITSA